MISTIMEPQTELWLWPLFLNMEIHKIAHYLTEILFKRKEECFTWRDYFQGVGVADVWGHMYVTSQTLLLLPKLLPNNTNDKCQSGRPKSRQQGIYETCRLHQNTEQRSLIDCCVSGDLLVCKFC